MITFDLTKNEAANVMLAVALAKELSPDSAKEKYEDAYKVLISQYAAQTTKKANSVEKLGTQSGNVYTPLTGWKDEGHGYHRYYVYDSHFGTITPSLLNGWFAAYRDNVIASQAHAKDFSNIDDAKKHIEQLAVSVVGK